MGYEMLVEEEVMASIIASFVLFDVVVPREIYDRRICLPVIFDDIVGVGVCDH